MRAKDIVRYRSDAFSDLTRRWVAARCEVYESGAKGDTDVVGEATQEAFLNIVGGLLKLGAHLSTLVGNAKRVLAPIFGAAVALDKSATFKLVDGRHHRRPVDTQLGANSLLGQLADLVEKTEHHEWPKAHVLLGNRGLNLTRGASGRLM